MNVLLYGLQVTLIGLAVVFIALTILIFFIKLLGVVLAEKKKPAKTEPAPAPVAVPAPVAEPVAVSNELDPELIAVISAAIAALDNSGKALVVRSVRRVSGWNRAAREEQVYRF